MRRTILRRTDLTDANLRLARFENTVFEDAILQITKISHESEHHLIKADQSGYIVIRGVKP